jgi:diguanylate cyclase (GGDEF)-like protein
MKLLISAEQAGTISSNQYLLSLNAYFFLLFIVVSSFLIYYIIKHELKLSLIESERYKEYSIMFDEVMGLVRHDQPLDTISESNLKKFFDPLTGCLSRLAYEELFMQYAHIKYASHCLDVIFLDLNGLKYVNDHFGHNYGDAYLKSFVNSIKSLNFAHEGFYRVGGDEFIIITLEGKVDFLSSLMDNANVALKSTFTHDTFRGSFSYGIATTCEINESSIHEIEHIADQRMYVMKHGGVSPTL